MRILLQERQISVKLLFSKIPRFHNSKIIWKTGYSYLPSSPPSAYLHTQSHLTLSIKCFVSILIFLLSRCFLKIYFSFKIMSVCGRVSAAEYRHPLKLEALDPAGGNELPRCGF